MWAGDTPSSTQRDIDANAQLTNVSPLAPRPSASPQWPFAPGKESWIVASCTGSITKAPNGEAWIERKSRLHCGPRFVQLPEARQRSRKMEMRIGRVSVCVEASAQPSDLCVPKTLSELMT